MKRINLAQLPNIKPQKQLLLISYQDKDLLNDFCQMIIHHYQIEETASVDILNPNDWEGLQQENLNYRLFPEAKAYLIHFDKAALNPKKLPHFDADSDDLYILCTPIFKHPSLEKMISDNKLEWFGLYAPFNNDLWSHFQTTITKLGFNLNPVIRSWWTDTSLNYIQVKQLIEKITLHYPNPKMLELHDIEEHLGLAQNLETQELIDAWMNQKPHQISIFLDKIKNTDLSLIIWIIQRNLLVLEALKVRPNQTQNIFQKHKIWPKQTASFIQFNQCLTKDSISQLLCLLQEIDSLFKSHQIALARQKLEYLLLYSASLQA